MGDAISLVIEEIEHGLRDRASDYAVGSLSHLAPEDATDLGKVLAGYLNKYVDALANLDVSQAAEVIAEGFRLELVALITESPDVRDQFFAVGARELSSACRSAATSVMAPLLWRRAVGVSWDTTQVSRFLDVSRQAIHKRVVGGSMLGVPGEHTTWFPTWQLDIGQTCVRPETKLIISAFRDRLGADVDPLIIASWATTPQLEDLEGLSPAEWLDGVSVGSEQLETAARRAAARLDQ